MTKTTKRNALNHRSIMFEQNIDSVGYFELDRSVLDVLLLSLGIWFSPSITSEGIEIKIERYI